MIEHLTALPVPLAALSALGPLGVAVVDDELRYVHVDETLARMNGRPPEEHLGRTIHEVLPFAADVLEPLVRRALAGEAVHDLRLVSPPPDGRVFRGSYLPVDGPDGPLCVALVVRDQDEDAALALRITEERLRVALEGTEVGFWEWDVRQDVVRWSENHGPIFGRPRGYQPRDYAEFLDAVVEEDRPHVQAVVGAALEGHDWTDEEWRIRRPDGEVRW
ncbi:MAG TPA: PAS domain-containing protein, partial [Baekduia sp.]|nr:PAS domain-containing protein [Baekduia sp.]